jgi:hypothetical protein
LKIYSRMPILAVKKCFMFGELGWSGLCWLGVNNVM